MNTVALPPGLVSLMSTLLAVCATATAQHAITHEDVWLMRRLGGLVASPDGKRVVYQVTEPAYDPKEQWADLWLASLADATPPRRLTFSKGGESGVDWSQDGERIVFSAKREGDEVAQLYVLPLSGGEAVRVTDLVLGARAAKWSPDGKRLLFVSEAFPGASRSLANVRRPYARLDGRTAVSQDGAMDKTEPAQKRVTANLPSDLLEEAQEVTGKGITDTLIEGLRLLKRSKAFEKAMALKGKLKLEIDLDALRERRR